ncbi:hypothetical protein ACFL1X_13725, partial [Candidatus Hydrogenedentota bacterium]
MSSFKGSGFDNPGYPHMDIKSTGSFSRDGASGGGIIVSLSRKALDLEGEKEVFIQVCTFKGGIEEQKKIELPRINTVDGKRFCDVADHI